MSQELLAAAAKIQSINRGFAWRNRHGTIHYDPYDGYSERKSHESTLGGTMDGATFRSLIIDESEEVVQVAGHGMITRATSGVLMKVVPPCELACYEEVQGTDLAPFFPKPYGSERKGPVAELRIEDATASMRMPCVMDVKMGTRTFGESECSSAKLRPELARKLADVDPTLVSARELEEGITKLTYLQVKRRLAPCQPRALPSRSLRGSRRLSRSAPPPAARRPRPCRDAATPATPLTDTRPDVVNGVARLPDRGGPPARRRGRRLRARLEVAPKARRRHGRVLRLLALAQPRDGLPRAAHAVAIGARRERVVPTARVRRIVAAIRVRRRGRGWDLATRRRLVVATWRAASWPAAAHDRLRKDGAGRRGPLARPSQSVGARE